MGNENRFTSTERDLELREEIRRKRRISICSDENLSLICPRPFSAK